MPIPLQRYLDLADVILLELDAEGRVVRINERGGELLGYRPDALVGQDWFEICIRPEDRDGIRAVFDALIRGDQTLPGRAVNQIVTRSGGMRVIDWRNRTITDADGQCIGTLSSGQDVTDREAADSALRQSLKRLEEIRHALNASAIVATTDRRGVITHANELFCRISGYRNDELVGHTHRVINAGYHPPAFFKGLWETICRGDVWRGDICNRTRDGVLYWVATTIVPFLDEAGEPYQFLAIRVDITDRKQAEQALVGINRRLVDEQAALVQAEKLSSIGLLSAGVAHEINNPLAGAMACLKMLEDGTVPPDRRGEYFHTIRDALSRIQRTVSSLLDYARPQPSGSAPVVAARLVSSCMLLMSPLTRKRRLEIELRLDPEARVLGDRAQLMQAVMNVLMNAVQAAPPGSAVVVDRAPGGVRDGLLGVRITDQGDGILPEHQSRVCDPFFTTKAEGEGTGLGLAITTGILSAHGGELEIESEPGRGAAVTLWLPLA